MLRIAICDDDKILVTQIEEMGFPLRLFSWKSFYGHSPERNDYGKKKN